MGSNPVGDATLFGQKIHEKNRRVRVLLASHMPDCRSRMRHRAIDDVTVEDVAFDHDEVDRVVDGARCQRRAELSSDRSARCPRRDRVPNGHQHGLERLLVGEF